MYHSLLLELPPEHYVMTIQLKEMKQSVISLCHSISCVIGGSTFIFWQMADRKLCFGGKFDESKLNQSLWNKRFPSSFQSALFSEHCCCQFLPSEK